MARTLTITVEPDQDRPFITVHYLRNLGEVIWTYLRQNEWGKISMAEIDAATATLVVRNVKAAKLRRLVRWVEEELKHHGVIGVVEIS